MRGAPAARGPAASRCLPVNRAHARGAGVRQKQSAKCACWWLFLFPCAEPDPNVACHAAPARFSQKTRNGQIPDKGYENSVAEKIFGREGLCSAETVG